MHHFGDPWVPKSKAVRDRPAYEDIVGSQRNAFENVIACPYPSINIDFEVVAYSCPYPWEHLNRGKHSVQLSSSMVAEPYCITVIRCYYGILMV